MNVTNGAYLKAVHSVHSNVLEDVIDKFETDANILKLKEWKKTINVFCSKLYDDDNKLYYYLCPNLSIANKYHHKHTALAH